MKLLIVLILFIAVVTAYSNRENDDHNTEQNGKLSELKIKEKTLSEKLFI